MQKRCAVRALAYTVCMQLTNEDVERIARLARIRLTKEEIEPMKGDLQTILGFVERLQAEDVEGVPPTAQVTGLENVDRRDEEEGCDAREEILNAAPRRERDVIEVRAVQE